jgi:MFS family permease
MLVSFPIGRWADTGNRRNILALSLGIWSIMTALAGVARNYAELIVARMATGVGVAGNYGPSLSIISDLFPLKNRGTPLGIWNTGTVFGFSFGLGVGAWIVDHYGWRYALYVFGAIGAIFALLLFALIREPTRRDDDGVRLDEGPAPRLWDTGRFMLSQRSIVHVTIGFTLLSLAEGGFNNWTTSFLVRSHDLSIAEAGGSLALIWLPSGIIGSFSSGYLMDVLGRRDTRWHVWLTGLAMALSTLPMAFIYLSESLSVVYTSILVSNSLFAFWYTSQMVLMTGLVGSRMRATAWAIGNFFTLGLGMAFGPQIVGFLSDFLEPIAGVHSLRYAMLSVIIFVVWAALHFWFAGRTLIGDYRRARTA